MIEGYSCALVGDILLQGHLYVTENFLAFHSNVFGYITKVSVLQCLSIALLFPIQIELSMSSVISITKEKTVRIIPNAVAISTLDDVHTFTSFMARDAAFAVITEAWEKALAKRNTKGKASY